MDLHKSSRHRVAKVVHQRSLHVVMIHFLTGPLAAEISDAILAVVSADVQSSEQVICLVMMA